MNKSMETISDHADPRWQLLAAGMLLAIASLACNLFTRAVDHPILPTRTSPANPATASAVPASPTVSASAVPASPIPAGDIDEATLQRLEINLGKSAQAKPGEPVQLQTGVTECCYVFKPVAVKTRWSVEPQTGVQLDPQTGLLVLATNVSAGAVYSVTADVQDGLKKLTTRITVYTEQANPLVGTWHEVKQMACPSLAISDLPGDDLLRELVFKADGTFQATFTPFEIYHDYWGTYTFDPQTGALEMAVQEGNYIPDQLDLQGQYKIDEQGNLALLQIWLGRREKTLPVGCGHLFARYGQ